jgi:hypothetical protein
VFQADGIPEDFAGNRLTVQMAFFYSNPCQPRFLWVIFRAYRLGA